MVARRKILTTAKFASVIDLEGFKILNDGQVECAGTLQRLELGPHSARESVGDIQGSRFELSSRTTVFLLKNTTEEVTQVHCQRSRRGWGDIQHPSFPILLRTARLEEIFAPQKPGTCPGWEASLTQQLFHGSVPHNGSRSLTFKHASTPR